MNRQRDRSRQNDGAGAMTQATRHIGSLASLKEWQTADLVDRADAIGGELSTRGMTTSSIRNFLDEVNRIQAETQGRRDGFDTSRVVLLKPLLAYSAGRETGRKQEVLKSFATLFSAAADGVQDAKDFKRFVDFTRAVVAYHRFHGGSNQ